MPAQLRKIQQSLFGALFYAFILLISSCAVKNSVSQVLGIEYNKPLSPSKSSGNGFCHIYNLTVSAAQQTAKSQKKLLFSNNSSEIRKLGYYNYTNSCTKEFKGLLFKVPLYILFKKVKYFVS